MKSLSLFVGHSNVAERNRDFNTINSGLTFKKGRLAELRYKEFMRLNCLRRLGFSYNVLCLQGT